MACSAPPFCLICKEPIAPSERANEETQAEDALNGECGAVVFADAVGLLLLMAVCVAS